jgi:putative GTP pyrophosphokinase
VTVGDVYDLAPELPATTTFGRADTENALPYQIAISMLTTKVRTLEQEFTRRDGYRAIEAVSSRIKTHDSIVAKAQRLCCPLTADDIRDNILDIAGVRITCGRVSDTYRIAARLSDLPDVTVIEVEDYIAKPKPNGYKSLHMIVEIPVRLSNRVQQVPVEVQIRTIAQDLWASCEHTISHTYPLAISDRLLDTLTQAADAAYRLDIKMERLHNEVARLWAASDPDGVQLNSPLPTAIDRCRAPRRTVPVKPTTHGNAPSQLPHAYLPQPADNARRNAAETHTSPRAGQVTVTDNSGPKATGRQAFVRNHNATGLDSTGFQR